MEWLLSTETATQVAAVSFLVTVAGFVITFYGLVLTYSQAKRARAIAEQVEDEVEKFSQKNDRSEAIGLMSEAKSAMEFAGPLASSGDWPSSVNAYDQARKALQKVRGLKTGLEAKAQNELRLVCDHLISYCDAVEIAVANKGQYPEIPAVRSAIRKNGEVVSRIQREIQEMI